MDDRKIEVSLAALQEIEDRVVQVNLALVRMLHAIMSEDLEQAAELRAVAQRANWENRRALIDAMAQPQDPSPETGARPGASVRFDLRELDREFRA